MKKTACAMALVGLLACAQAQAALVTWGVNGSFSNGAAVSGTVSFDDASIQGLYDGYPDPNDTHVVANFVLSSAALGLSNTLFDNFQFQPFYNSLAGDGPHVDSQFSSPNNYFYLTDFSTAILYDSNFNNVADGSWSFDRNANTVPEPGSLALLGLGLAGLVAMRKRKPA